RRPRAHTVRLLDEQRAHHRLRGFRRGTAVGILRLARIVRRPRAHTVRLLDEQRAHAVGDLDVQRAGDAGAGAAVAGAAVAGAAVAGAAVAAVRILETAGVALGATAHAVRHLADQGAGDRRIGIG